MRFTKMQGLGNDYVYVDCTQRAPEDLPELARRISDRHFGVGSDGLICIFPSEKADFRMRMFNADGSEGEMCGNGIRCVGKFVYDHGLTDQTTVRVETLAGVKILCLQVEGGQVVSATVDMGLPVPQEPRTLQIMGRPYQARPVSMGNPHAVVFLDQIDALDLPAIGPAFENHPSFPNRTNTEFVVVLDDTHLKMRVWERGSGETLSCGTGACAVLVAGVLNDLTDRQVTVKLIGGDLLAEWREETGEILLTGPAVHVFDGEV